MFIFCKKVNFVLLRFVAINGIRYVGHEYTQKNKKLRYNGHLENIGANLTYSVEFEITGQAESVWPGLGYTCVRLAMSCDQLSHDQICTQVDVNFSPLDNPSLVRHCMFVGCVLVYRFTRE